jgi:wyosine [tRNA(Phe)-imidazoG37] synthetase (radical SAM superfamily)
MGKRKYKYIYGPVSSWRLGRSLGVDPVSQAEKICTFDCVYCQAGAKQAFAGEREIFVPTKAIIKEITSLPPVKIDYITFSGKGEPTLAKNLGEIAGEIRKTRDEKIAIITNASLISRLDIQQDLRLMDFVMAKLDACSMDLLGKINRPSGIIEFNNILRGISEFRSGYKGKFALQIMFVGGNKGFAEDIAAIAGRIGPDEVQLNTPLRPCLVKPLSKKDMDEIKKYFDGMNVVSVYDADRKKTEAINREDTLKRRGAYD